MKGGMYGAGLKGKATRLHSLVVRTRGACERCGQTSGPFDAAHIVPRRYNAVRTDENNAWCLCKGCHLRCTEWASEHVALIERTIGTAAYELLRFRAETGVKANDAFWLAEVARLTQLLEEAA